ncbi:hypothetical protein KJ673_04150 [Patescibacteria group bacterium]|nr:hypothetical protein [Patescibacteria group bacterium]MCG2687215.1 hypothetical protein [Candidatus Parcubacteria bacterium]
MNNFMPEVPGKERSRDKITVIKRAEMEPLTAYDEEFLISHVGEGEDVLVGQGGGDLYLRCDFSAFAERLEQVTPEKIEELFIGVNKLEKEAPNLDEKTRRLLHACWIVARIVKKILEAPSSDFFRNQSFDEYKTETADGKRVSVKPLSKCIGLAVCSEYSLLAHHVLEKLGVQCSVVVGAFKNDTEDLLADRHTFLVLNDGNYVFDPTNTSVQDKCWPPKIFIPETPLTAENLRDMERDDSKPFGKKIICIDVFTKKKKIYGTGAI